MRILILLFVLGPLLSSGQFKLTGVVLDSVTKEPLPGVNVIPKGTNQGTVTTSQGGFEIDIGAERAELVFAFIGMRTKTLVISQGEHPTVYMSLDNGVSEDTPNHYVKTSVEIGYYGDKNEAPIGTIVNYSLQSIGKVSLDINSSFKYWKENKNTGLEFSLSKDLTGKINYAPDNLLLSFKSIDYGDKVFSLKQARGLIANELSRYYLSIDIGGAYNTLIRNDEQGLTRKQYFSGILGLTKIFSFDSFLKNWGFYSSLSYNPDQTMYEIGTYKGIYIKNLPSITLMAKYYNYGTFDGVLLSVRFKLFSTKYYCCHSWKVYYEYINSLK